MNSIQKLTELQHQVGYKEGPVNLIALFGLFGESGEVLEEWLKTVTLKKDIHDSWISDGIAAADTIDRLKKLIRDSKLEINGNRFAETKRELDGNFDKELADALYYLNAIAINRGKTLEYYAQLSYDKVSAKIQQNIEHGIDHKEMPPKQ
jgi:NTP pyrophosphatase (non-canonical NTP hydrolase)